MTGTGTNHRDQKLSGSKMSGTRTGPGPILLTGPGPGPEMFSGGHPKGEWGSSQGWLNVPIFHKYIKTVGTTPLRSVVSDLTWCCCWQRTSVFSYVFPRHVSFYAQLSLHHSAKVWKLNHCSRIAFLSDRESSENFYFFKEDTKKCSVIS